MTIQEILDRHKVAAFTGADTACSCDRTWRTNTEYRAHVAEVLDKHMQEARAQELVLFARQLSDCVRAQTLAERTPGEPRIAVDVIHLLNSRANHLRKETPNGR